MGLSLALSPPQMAPQLSYLKASGPGAEAGVGGRRSMDLCPLTKSLPAQGAAAKTRCSQQTASCAGPRGAHLVAAPGLFTVAFIESD